MAQFMRPNSNITTTNWTNGFNEVDEVSADDSDLAYSTINTVATLEMGLSDPSTPDTGTCTVSYRIAKTDNLGNVDGAGNSLTVTATVLEGASTIATDSARTPDGTWTTYTFTFSTGSVSDWTDLRLQFVTTASGGAPGNRRGCGLSWTQIAIPDAPASSPTASLYAGVI